MKTKKILFTTAGVFKCVVGGCIFALFLLVLLLSGLIKDVLVQDGELLQQMVQELVQEEAEMAFLLEYSNAEIADYLLGTVNIFAIVMIIVGLCAITLGVFTLIFAKKYNTMLQNRLKRKIIFTVLDYVFYIGLIANILTSVAIFTKDKSVDEIVIES